MSVHRTAAAGSDCEVNVTVPPRPVTYLFGSINRIPKRGISGFRCEVLDGGIAMSAGLLLGLVVAVAAPGPKGPPKKDGPSPVGEWVAERITVAGTDHPLGGDPVRYVFAADRGHAIYRGARRLTEKDSWYSADPAGIPPAIDQHAGGRKGEESVALGIYKVEGDTLTLCFSQRRGDRPKTFESTTEMPAALYVLKRVTAKD